MPPKKPRNAKKISWTRIIFPLFSIVGGSPKGSDLEGGVAGVLAVEGVVGRMLFTGSGD